MVADFGVLQVFFSMLWFFLFVMWIMLVIQVFSDIFRSADLSGVMKAAWLLFVIVLPYLGVLVYLIARGGKMHQRQVTDAKAEEAAVRAYIRDAAGGSAAELERLAALKQQGVIDDAEFAAMKAKIIG